MRTIILYAIFIAIWYTVLYKTGHSDWGGMTKVNIALVMGYLMRPVVDWINGIKRNEDQN